LAANYLKFKPTSQMGTRTLRFITITFDNGSDSDINLTNAYANGTGTFTGSYLDSNSYFAKAVRTVETYFEVWWVGTPSSTAFTVVVSDDTAQDSALDTNVVTVPADYGQVEAAIKAAVGIGAKSGLATPYNGAVTCATVVLSGAALA
jgi:hypothetical protein